MFEKVKCSPCYCDTFWEVKSHCFGHSESVFTEHQVNNKLYRATLHWHKEWTRTRPDSFSMVKHFSFTYQRVSEQTLIQLKLELLPLKETAHYRSAAPGPCKARCLVTAELESGGQHEEAGTTSSCINLFLKNTQLLGLLHSFQNPSTCCWRQPSPRHLILAPDDMSFPNLISSGLSLQL